LNFAPIDLSPTAQISSKFEQDFHLAYVVTLAEHQLNTDLHVYNPSESARDLEFQALFHNYIRAPASLVRIKPLQNVGYYDKTQQTDEGKAARRIESRAEVDVNNFTDSVYEDASGSYQVTWPDGEVNIVTKNLDNVVVWNPQEEGKKLADMEAGGW
jgi:glucose-6-phosphate 1-epimerase